MKRVILILVVLCSFLQAKEKIEIDGFVGHDIFGKMKVDRNDIKEDYSDYSFNTKLTLAKKVYNSIYVTGSIQYETYYIEADTYKDEYNLIPITAGIRYVDEKRKKDFVPYMTLAVGANILLNDDTIPVDTKINGFAELDCGVVYKEKYLFELAYKHHAFTYEPKADTSNEFWNGRMLNFNLGYKFR